MKLGITPWHFAEPLASSLQAQATFAEAAGFDSFWVPEHHFFKGAIPDPLMLLAVVAAATSTIKLGTSSYLLPIRHPLQAAEQVAVLDQLCGGRLILGVGRGFDKSMLAAFGCDPADKRTRFEHALQVMHKAWRGEPVFTGDDGRTLRLQPLPLQQPQPPIWVAAFGKLALEQAGKLGLPYLASPVESLATLQSNHAHYENAASASGMTPAAEIPVMRSIFVTDNAGTTAAVLGEISKMAAKRGRKELAEAPEQCCIVGEPAYVRERIAGYRDCLGITTLILAGLFLEGLSDTDHRRSAEQTLNLLSW